MASVMGEVDFFLQGQVQQEAEKGTGRHIPGSDLGPQAPVSFPCWALFAPEQHWDRPKVCPGQSGSGGHRVH